MIGAILPRERQFLSYHVGGAESTALPLFRIRNLAPVCRTTVGKGADSELSRELKEVMA